MNEWWELCWVKHISKKFINDIFVNIFLERSKLKVKLMSPNKISPILRLTLLQLFPSLPSLQERLSAGGQYDVMETLRASTPALLV